MKFILTMRETHWITACFYDNIFNSYNKLHKLWHVLHRDKWWDRTAFYIQRVLSTGLTLGTLGAYMSWYYSFFSLSFQMNPVFFKIKPLQKNTNTYICVIQLIILLELPTSPDAAAGLSLCNIYLAAWHETRIQLRWIEMVHIPTNQCQMFSNTNVCMSRPGLNIQTPSGNRSQCNMRWLLLMDLPVSHL